MKHRQSTNQNGRAAGCSSRERLIDYTTKTRDTHDHQTPSLASPTKGIARPHFHVTFRQLQRQHDHTIQWRQSRGPLALDDDDRRTRRRRPLRCKEIGGLPWESKSTTLAEVEVKLMHGPYKHISKHTFLGSSAQFCWFVAVFWSFFSALHALIHAEPNSGLDLLVPTRFLPSPHAAHGSKKEAST